MGLIELTGWGDVLRFVGGLFWVLVGVALLMALTVPKTRNGKIIAVLVIVGLFAAFPGRWAWEKKQKYDAARARYEKAEAMFQERCKKAGVFIYRRAEDVDGIFLLKVRPKSYNYGDKGMDDPYGRDYGGDGYIESFFWGRNEKGATTNIKVGGYRYADAIDPKDGVRYRYTGRLDEPWKRSSHALKGHRVFVLDKIPAPDPAPRYGVTYDDISTHEERDYWIAGSSLRVIDLKTNEVMAERIGYMMDPGQGSTGTARSPWLEAANYACPRFGPPGHSSVPRSFHQNSQTRDFVEKILHLPQEK